jgi:hypothetical protein
MTASEQIERVRATGFAVEDPAKGLASFISPTLPEER